jgi:hypothetical protein
MTFAEFFNAKLTGKPVTDPLKMGLMDQISVRPEQSGQSLTQRITLKLQG